MIHVEELSKQYGTTHAVNGISFDIRRGEVVGFLGPNGAGKTTTLRMLTGYLKPSAGYIEMAGIDIARDPMGVRRRIGYLPELNPLYEDLEVLEYLEFSGRIHALASGFLKKRIHSVVDSCGLGEVIGRDVGELSKGYKQRLGLALAILHDPEIILLDEPTSGLDPNQIREIRRLIQDLRKEKTVILSTHILQEVQASCDRVLIINRGRIVASGTSDELQNMVVGRALIRLQLKSPETDRSKVLQEISGVAAVRYTGYEPDIGTSYEIEAEQGQDIRERIFTAMVDRGWVIIELHRQAVNLEEIFRRLTEDVS